MRFVCLIFFFFLPRRRLPFSYFTVQSSKDRRDIPARYPRNSFGVTVIIFGGVVGCARPARRHIIRPRYRVSLLKTVYPVSCSAADRVLRFKRPGPRSESVVEKSVSFAPRVLGTRWQQLSILINIILLSGSPTRIGGGASASFARP